MGCKEEEKTKHDALGERENFSLMLKVKESGWHTGCGEMS